MGTRSLIRVFEDDDVLVAIYGQFDGYQSGRGAEIKEVLSTTKISNGVRTGAHNGMGCLAAKLIKGLKKETGSTYIFRHDAEPQEFNYDLIGNSGVPVGEMQEVQLVVKDSGGAVLFDGLLADYNPTEE